MKMSNLPSASIHRLPNISSNDLNRDNNSNNFSILPDGLTTPKTSVSATTTPKIQVSIGGTINKLPSMTGSIPGLGFAPSPKPQTPEHERKIPVLPIPPPMTPSPNSAPIPVMPIITPSTHVVPILTPKERMIRDQERLNIIFESGNEYEEFIDREENFGTKEALKQFNLGREKTKIVKTMEQKMKEEKQRIADILRDLSGTGGKVEEKVEQKEVKSFRDAIIPFLTSHDLVTFNFQAYNGLLVFKQICNPESMETITKIIQNTLIMNAGCQGTVLVKYEPSEVLVFFKMESKIRKTDPRFFNISGITPTDIYTMNKENLPKVERYITGKEATDKKKKPIKGAPDITPEDVKKVSEDDTFKHDANQAFNIAIRTKTHFDTASFIGPFIRDIYNAKIGIKESYLFDDTKYFYQEFTSLELIFIIQKECSKALNAEYAHCIEEISKGKTPQLEERARAIIALNLKIGDYPFMHNVLKGLISTNPSGEFVKVLNKHPDVAPVMGGMLVTYSIKDSVIPRTKEMMEKHNCPFSFEYPVHFVPYMTSHPLIDKFLDDITLGRKDLLSYTFERLGYGITGWTWLQKFYYLLGYDGSNGKSTLILLIEKCIGQHFKKAPKALLYKTKGALPRDGEAPTLAKMHVKDARFVYIAELNESDELDVEKIKVMTGEDGDEARGCGGKFESYKPQSTIFIATNRLPVIPPDEALLRRHEIIPLEAKYVDEPEYNEFKESRPHYRLKDPHFKEKVFNDQNALNYFFTLLVKGAERCKNNPTPKPACIKEALEEYKTQQDSILQFLAECCEFPLVRLDKKDPACMKEKTEDLFISYGKWHRIQYPGEKIGYTKATFGKQMVSKLGEESKCHINPGSCAGYTNIRIKNERRGGDNLPS